MATEGPILRAFQRNLQPLQELAFRDSQADYRWHCFYAQPDASDPAPNHAVLALDIEYIRPADIDELRLICVASDRDSAIRPYKDDPRYVFRWLVDKQLDPNAVHVFDCKYLAVDGNELSYKRFDASQDTTPAHELRASIPEEHLSDDEIKVSLRVLVREYLGKESRISLKTILFRETRAADFRLVVHDGVGARKVEVSESELGTVGNVDVETAVDAVGESIGYYASLRTRGVVKANSTMEFKIFR